MAQVTYTKENDKWFADFDNRKKTLWKERWISPIDMPEPTPSVEKGQIITMNLDGTDKRFRVIKIVDGSIVEVLSMSNATNSAYDTGNTHVYEGKSLDTYLNSSWYNTLNSTAKSAIVDKTFKQDSWCADTSGNPDYQGNYGSNHYQISLNDASFGNEITRHAYAISIQDIIDYLEVTPQMTQADTTLTAENIWKMFWNDSSAHGGNYVWLRSAFISAFSQTFAFIIRGDIGYLGGETANTSCMVRPAFQIDLTKIEWTPTIGE